MDLKGLLVRSLGNTIVGPGRFELPVGKFPPLIFSQICFEGHYRKLNRMGDKLLIEMKIDKSVSILCLVILILLFISPVLPWWSWEVERQPTPYCYMSVRFTFIPLLIGGVSGRAHGEGPIVGGRGPTTAPNLMGFVYIAHGCLVLLFFALVLYCGGMIFQKPLIKGILTFFAGVTCTMTLVSFFLNLVYPLREFKYGETFIYSDGQEVEEFISDLSQHLISGLSIGFYLLTIVTALMFLLTAILLTIAITPLSKPAKLCVVGTVLGLASFFGSYILMGITSDNPLSWLLLALGAFIIGLYAIKISNESLKETL